MSIAIGRTYLVPQGMAPDAILVAKTSKILLQQKNAPHRTSSMCICVVRSFM